MKWKQIASLVWLSALLASGCEGEVAPSDAGAPPSEGGAHDAGDPPRDAAVEVDAGETGDAAGPAGSDAGGGVDAGPTCLPSPLSGTWEGDAHARAGCGPFVFQRLDIDGDLIVDEGVEIAFESWVRVAGDLDVRAGARLVCVVGPPTSGYYLQVSGASGVHGTSTAPVVLTRRPVGGVNNMCEVRLGTASVEHARFQATPGIFGAGSVVRDSVFDPSGNGGDRTFVQVEPGSVLEHDRFERAVLRGRSFTARYNHFDGVAYETSIEVCMLCGDGRDACTGTRSDDPAVIVTDNVFDVDPERAVIGLGRAFGEVQMPNNHFALGAPRDPRAWRPGETRGCPDGSAHGGPLILTPLATAPPARYGPRP